jgi:hypothetical protein
MTRKRKQSDPCQLILPLPPLPQKNEKVLRAWEPPLVAEPPSSKPLKQYLLFGLFGQLEPNPDYFYWPSTNATIGDGSIELLDWPEIGPLRHCGYVVGEKGKLRSIRRAILTRLFGLNVVPNLASPDEVLEWGEAFSAARLKKMADSIAAFCRNAKRKKRAWMRRAIENYEDDLAWLKKEYYDGRFDRKFKWPPI